MRLRLVLPVLVVGAAAAFALSGRWPWRRLADPVVTAQAAPVLPFTEVHDTLRRGETLGALFARHGAGAGAVATLATLLDPRRLKAGLVFQVRQQAGDSLPSEIRVRTAPDQRLLLRRASAGWSAVSEPIRWTPDEIRLEGAIESSLYDALDAAVPDLLLRGEDRIRLAWDLADVFAWQVDFTRDIQPGDRFRVVVERLVSEEGEVRYGRIMAADLVNDGKTLTAFRFDAPGAGGFYDLAGNSLRRAFLRAPLQFRRISSSFSRSRLHPILGIVRRHEGTDYAADRGTPVLSAADGVVLRAGWSGGYGNLVEIRHRNGITTRYGHLSRIAASVRAGARVGQGEVIGNVGMTGLASGPHLHYEFRVNGVARDPRTVDAGSGEPVPPALRAAFAAEEGRLAAFLAGAAPVQLAQSAY